MESISIWPKDWKRVFQNTNDIYDKKAPTQKRDLKNKLHNLNMERDETIESFFTNISQVKDQLARINVVIDEDDLLQNAIDGLPSSWEPFLVVVNRWEEYRNFERLWYDCIQEEGNIQSKVVWTKEEILSLTLRMKKRRKPFNPKNFLLESFSNHTSLFGLFFPNLRLILSFDSNMSLSHQTGSPPSIEEPNWASSFNQGENMGWFAWDMFPT